MAYISLIPWPRSMARAKESRATWRAPSIENAGARPEHNHAMFQV
jgi:hypothetical protein